MMYREKTETCSNRIAEALTVRNMKQSDLCKLASIPKGSLSLYLKGSYEPKQDRIYAMAMVLNVSEAWLMGYDVPMERQKNTPSELELTEGEKDIINLFRQIPENKQAVVLEMIRLALKTQE